ncbi:class I SAM-dependent methyltransferase [Candidatus Avelusimicrobium sp.]
MTAFETVYFWPDLKKSFSEVYRVLKPGGMFMFSYGLESSATMRYWADRIDEMRILPIDEMTKILSDVGFENLQTATKGDYTINIRIQKPKGTV